MKVAHLVTSEPDIHNESTTYRIPGKLEFNKLIARQTFSFLPDGNSVLQTSNAYPVRLGSSAPSTPSTASPISSSVDIPSSNDNGTQNSNTHNLLQVHEDGDLQEQSPQDPDSSSIQERLLQMVR